MGHRVSVHRTRVARWGEALAADFLRRRGARVLGRNLRHGRGEIDLLVAFGSRRVAVEVKTRVGDPADPVEAFDAHKARRVRTAANAIAGPGTRVDLVAVSVGADGVQVRWVPGAA